MNSKKTMFIAAAAFLALSAAACGKVDKESSDVALDINTATSDVTASSDDSSDAAVTTSVTTSAASTKEGETTTKKGYSAKPDNSTHTTAAPNAAEPPKADPEPDNQEPQTPPEPTPEPTDPPTDSPTDPPTEPPVNVEFSFDSLQSDAAPFISQLPVQFTKGSGAGCVTGNYDVVSYRSPEITIDCYVDGGIEYIFSVTINENVCSTAEGIAIGSSRADVVAAYGAGLGEPDSVLYNDGSKELWIDYSGDTVSGIQYYIAV